MPKQSRVRGETRSSGIPPRGRHPSGRGWVGSSLRGGLQPSLEAAILDAYGLAGDYKYLDGVDPCDESAFAELTAGPAELQVLVTWVIGSNPLTEYRVWLAIPDGG